jgi:hypothetical protein
MKAIAISPGLHEFIRHRMARAGVTDLHDLRHALECWDAGHRHQEELWDEIDRLAAEYGTDCQGPFFVRDTEENGHDPVG